MRDIATYLKKLDAEITSHRQQIALHQLEIAKIEDARRVIVGIEEREAGHFGPDHGLNGEPIVIARRPSVPKPPRPAALLAASEAGKLSEAAKTGEAYDAGKVGVPQRVAEVLAADGPSLPKPLAAKLGVAPKAVHRALSSLKMKGAVKQGKDKRYDLTGKTVRFSANGGPRKVPGATKQLPFGETPGKVLQALDGTHGPLSSGQIVVAVYGPHAPGAIAKQDRDRVYGALLALKRAGKVVKDHAGRYSKAA